MAVDGVLGMEMFSLLRSVLCSNLDNEERLAVCRLEVSFGGVFEGIANRK